ncbi:hypothetical protein ACWCRD_33010 [Streptomyces sp. NPDC002092]
MTSAVARRFPAPDAARFSTCRPAPLRPLWSEAALVEAEVVLLEVPTRFADFADL